MNAGTLNSSSSYTLYYFIEMQAVWGTSSVTEKPRTIELEEFVHKHSDLKITINNLFSEIV